MRKRRGRGEGAIYQRTKNGRTQWCASISLGYGRDESGKPLRKRRVVYGDSKADVQHKLRELQGKASSGTLTEPTRWKVSEFLDQWLEGARSSIRETTFASYENTIRKHINPEIGGARLAVLEPSAVQAMYTRLADAGVSARTRELVHAVLHRALKKAVKWGHLSRNPCDAVDRPRAEKRRMSVWNSEQVGVFLAAAKGNRLEALYILALSTGLRQGELLGLQWADVDLAAGTLSVRRTLLEVRIKQPDGKWKVVVKDGPPKTEQAKRLVVLPAVAVEALKAHRKRMFAAGHAGVAWVFCDTEGGALRRTNLRRRSFETLIKAAKLPKIRFHDLRHTAATLALSEGLHPKVVQERLGHAQIRVTLDTYSHALPSIQREAAERLDALFKSMSGKGHK